MRATTLSFLFLLVFSPLTLAVPQFTDTAQIMRSYDYSAGLTQSSITALAQDQFGYIWVGTQAGLNRFDGHEFKQFRPKQQDKNSLSGGFITDICISDQDVWIGTHTGISRYNTLNGRFTSFLASDFDTITSDRVNDLTCESSHVLVSTANGESYQINKSTLKVSNSGLKGNFIRSPQTQNNYTFYLTDKGLMKINEQQQPKLLLEGEFKILKVREQRAILLTKSEELIVYDLLYDRVLWSKTYAEVSNITLNNLYVSTNEILLATNNGVYLFKFDGTLLNHWYKRQQSNGLQDNNILSVMRDKNKGLWIGTETRGLHFFSQLSESFGHVSSDNYPDSPLATPDTRTFAIDQLDRIWVGTSAGVYIFNGEGFIESQFIYKPLIAVQGSFVTKLFMYESELWIATRGNGVFRFSLDTETLEHFKPDFGNGPELSFNDITVYDGVLLLSSRTMGLMFYNENNNKLMPYFASSLDAPSHVSSMLVVKEALWFGSIGNGLFRYKGDELQQISTSDGLLSNLVFMLVQDSYGRVWVASEQGITLIHNDFSIERTFTQNEGLSNTAIWGLIYDGVGHVWAGTSGGLSRIDISNFNVHNFSPTDGIQDNEFNYNAAWLAPDGRLFVGGAKGFNQFYPQELDVDNSARPLLVSEIELLGEPLKPAEDAVLSVAPELAAGLVLAHNQDIISLNYSSLDYGAEQNQFYYRVIGLSEQWLKLASGVRQVSLLKLKPGDYVIEAYTINRFNVASPVHQFSISIAAPWWWNTTSKSFYIFLILALIASIVYARQQRYKKVVRDNIKMSELRQRLEWSLWASGDELWDWHVNSNKIYRHTVFSKVDYGDAGSVMTIDDFDQFVHPKDCILVEEKVRECIEGKTDSYEIAIRVKDLFEQWTWVLDRGKVVKRDENGKATRIAGALKDIAELKKNQDALQTLNEQLEINVAMRTDQLYKKNQKLEQAMMELQHTQQELIESEKMASLGGLVAGVAHEINTPLGVALTALTYNQENLATIENKLANKSLRQQDLDNAINEQNQGYALILRNLDRAQSLISNFKQVAVDQSSEQARNIFIKSYLREVFDSLVPLTKGKQIEIDIVGEDFELHTYPGAIYQVITNFLNNSMIHGFEGMGTGKIEVSLAREGNYWLMSYTDNGKGMNSEILKTVFDPFVTTKRNQGGCGLGMHIVYNLVTQLLKGEIKCSSTFGEGISIKLKLPTELL
ncbi:sensor histidine kinase [Pseudoalteromonas phenolica]|uniref:sensor histidine kinase n=1 Tax=Pseudoalteromonas phenolica TaxID=161398 RepID=UPI00110AE286|nr:two-component regulator propeller domain-containing protein [Pseudoalteromonas phenolica]TMO53359.1 PAS domain-containing sensor histidine kinase [Pseudoalteromonas phenolica]